LLKTGWWSLRARYTEDERETRNEDDELQKVSYVFEADLYTHALTLNYEPVSNNSKIPAYTQKCVCTMDAFPDNASLGESITINLNAEYIGKNDYAGISDTYWIYSNDERVKIVNNDGYAKGDVFVGDSTAEARDTLKTSFTVTFPTELKETDNEFYIYLESYCGKSVFIYEWEHR